MNMYLLRRLGFLFALLCVTAVASHPGAALSGLSRAVCQVAMLSKCDRFGFG